MTSFAAVALAGVFSLGVSWAAMAGTTDSQTSSDNSKLTCSLSVADQNSKATVTWTITGATSVRIEPLSFTGNIPMSGSQTIDSDGVVHIVLIAKDADGHTVRCHAGIGGSTDFAHGSVGTGSPNRYATSSSSV